VGKNQMISIIILNLSTKIMRWVELHRIIRLYFHFTTTETMLRWTRTILTTKELMLPY